MPVTGGQSRELVTRPGQQDRCGGEGLEFHCSDSSVRDGKSFTLRGVDFRAGPGHGGTGVGGVTGRKRHEGTGDKDVSGRQGLEPRSAPGPGKPPNSQQAGVCGEDASAHSTLDSQSLRTTYFWPVWEAMRRHSCWARGMWSVVR